MINKIIKGISNRLYEYYDGDIEIYTEDVNQCLNKPSFFVKIIDSSMVYRVNNGEMRNHYFDVMYFPEDEKSNKEMHSITDDLYECLEIIDFGHSKLRGFNMRAEKIDNVLHFFVNYNVLFYRKDSDEYMEVLEIKEHSKEG